MKEFYIENIRQGSDCCVWWRIDGNGYTRNLNEAWKVSEEKAKSICRDRPDEDIAREVNSVNILVVHHVPR